MKQTELKRSQKPMKRSGGLSRSSKPRKRAAVSAASPAQRAKVKDAVSVISGQGPCDPAHIWPRSLGGCGDALCVVPLTRDEHRAYDDGDLDLLPALVAQRRLAEIQHALTHVNGSLLRLLQRVTNKQWKAVPA